MIYILRVITGQEKITAEMLEKKAKSEQLKVYSIIGLEKIKGYVFIEAENENEVLKLTQKTKNVKSFINKPVNIDEIKELIKTTDQETSPIKVGDIVEMTSGPFKNERARVIKIDDAKEELTVELIEIAVPIPVTTKSKNVKIAQKAEGA